MCFIDVRGVCVHVCGRNSTCIVRLDIKIKYNTKLLLLFVYLTLQPIVVVFFTSR